MTSARQIGTLVAIPIKGRKLVNRSGGKQSPYVQLKLGSEQKKRTRASLIAAAEPEWDQEIRLDVFHGQMDMHVAVYDEGKKNELIGEGVLMLHEVVDKGELDVWFPIKYNGTPTGDIYFELTFYAADAPPAAGATPPIPQTQFQTPIRHNQPGFQGGGPGLAPVPHTPPIGGYGGSPAGPPAPFPGNVYQPAYNTSPQPFAPAQPGFSPVPAPYGAAPTSGPGFNPAFGGNSPFRPPNAGPYTSNTSPPFSHPNAAGGFPTQMPVMSAPFNNGPVGGNNYPPNNNNNPPRFPMQPVGGQPMNAGPGFPQGPVSGPPNGYPNNPLNSYPANGPNNGPPNSYPNNGPNNNLAGNGPPNSYPNNNSSGPNINYNSRPTNNFNNGPNNNNNFNSGPNNNNFNNGPNNNNFNNGPNNNFNNGPNNNNNHSGGQGNNFNNNNTNFNGQGNNFNNNQNNGNNFNNNNNNNNMNVNNLRPNSNNNNHPPGTPAVAPVTPLVQYNYSLESFP